MIHFNQRNHPATACRKDIISCSLINIYVYTILINLEEADVEPKDHRLNKISNLTSDQTD